MAGMLFVLTRDDLPPGMFSILTLGLGTFQGAEKAGKDDLVRVQRSPDKKTITAYVRDVGEEPPGVELNRSSDTFSVDVA